MYFNIDTNNSNWNISDFVGKTVTVKADVNPSRRMKLWIGYQSNGNWSYQAFAWHSTSEPMEHSREIPSTATRVILRFEGGEQQGDTCILDNLRFWLV